MKLFVLRNEHGYYWGRWQWHAKPSRARLFKQRRWAEYHAMRLRNPMAVDIIEIEVNI